MSQIVTTMMSVLAISLAFIEILVQEINQYQGCDNTDVGTFGGSDDFCHDPGLNLKDQERICSRDPEM